MCVLQTKKAPNLESGGRGEDGGFVESHAIKQISCRSQVTLRFPPLTNFSFIFSE